MSPFLALDYGQRRIGIAVSDPSDSLARAIGTHRTDADGPFFQFLDPLIRKYNIEGLVFGLPLTTAGTEGDQARCVRAFAQKVAEHTQLPVAFEDERFSSREASSFLRMGGQRGGEKSKVDAVAAEIILQQFLDRRHREQQSDKSE
jgi:putative Holliday junction resolvase